MRIFNNPLLLFLFLFGQANCQSVYDSLNIGCVDPYSVFRSKIELREYSIYSDLSIGPVQKPSKVRELQINNGATSFYLISHFNRLKSLQLVHDTNTKITAYLPKVPIGLEHLGIFCPIRLNENILSSITHLKSFIYENTTETAVIRLGNLFKGSVQTIEHVSILAGDTVDLSGMNFTNYFSLQYLDISCKWLSGIDWNKLANSNLKCISFFLDTPNLKIDTSLLNVKKLNSFSIGEIVFSEENIELISKLRQNEINQLSVEFIIERGYEDTMIVNEVFKLFKDLPGNQFLSVSLSCPKDIDMNALSDKFSEILGEMLPQDKLPIIITRTDNYFLIETKVQHPGSIMPK